MLNVLFQVLTPNETVVWIPRKSPISEHSAYLEESLREAKSAWDTDNGGSHSRELPPPHVGRNHQGILSLYIPDSHLQLIRNKATEKIFIINHESNETEIFLISRNKVKHCPLKPFLFDINLWPPHDYSFHKPTEYSFSSSTRVLHNSEIMKDL